MEMTRHARERWAERFGHLIPEEEWVRARRVGKKTKRKIAMACKNHRHLMEGGYKGFYYRITREGLVFVVATPELVITVFKLKV
jgi:hypothetical protein